MDTLLLAQGFRGPYIRDKDVAASKSPKAASYPPAFRARMQIQNITKIEKEESCSVLVPCQPMAAPVVLESVPRLHSRANKYASLAIRQSTILSNETACTDTDIHFP